MIQQYDVKAGAYFLIPHPDIEGTIATAIIDDVYGQPFNQMVRYHSIDSTAGRKPTTMGDFCKRAQYPAFVKRAA